MGQMSQRSSVIHACGRTTRTRHAIPRRTLSGTTHGEALAKPRHLTFGTTRMYTFFCIFRLSCLHALSPFLVFGSGKAGGGILPNPDGSERAGPGDAKFTSTIHAKQGDLGSLVLKKGPSQATWRAGAEVEVMWSMRSNHGGGVQWRLCPVEDNLTEACMQRNPIPFVGRQYLLYRNGTRQLLKSKYAVASYQPGVTPKSEPPATGYMVPGTGFFPNATCPGGYGCPVGATWALNPIPVRPHSLNHFVHSVGSRDNHTYGPVYMRSFANLWRGGWQDGCQQGSRGCITAAGSQYEFEPPCLGEIDVQNPKDRATWHLSDLGLCRGERPWHVSIVDVLRIPSTLRPGDYVLGFRWDAE